MASLQGQLGFKGQCLSLWELAPQAIWAKTLTALLLKLKTYPHHISTPLLWNIWPASSYQFVLKPLINSYNQDPAPCRQHCSTLLITKILTMPLTGPDNPLLCHYFCCFLKWVSDNEMFTTGDTLTCPYGGLREEVSDLHSLRAVRG